MNCRSSLAFPFAFCPKDHLSRQISFVSGHINLHAYVYWRRGYLYPSPRILIVNVLDCWLMDLATSLGYLSRSQPLTSYTWRILLCKTVLAQVILWVIVKSGGKLGLTSTFWGCVLVHWLYARRQSIHQMKIEEASLIMKLRVQVTATLLISESPGPRWVMAADKSLQIISHHFPILNPNLNIWEIGFINYKTIAKNSRKIVKNCRWIRQVPILLLLNTILCSYGLFMEESRATWLL